jgi:hypothetical protein
MSEGNFEVMPIGTTVELLALRSFARNMIEVLDSNVDPTSKWDRSRPLVKEVKDFYTIHNEKYFI